LLAIITIRHFFHFAYSLSPIDILDNMLVYLDSGILISTPFFYLYFENLVFEDGFKAKKSIHFALPVILFFIITKSKLSNGNNLKFSLIVNEGLPNLAGTIFIILSMLFALGYLIAGFILLRRNVWNRKSEIKVIQEQNDLIKKWTLFLFAMFLLLFLIRLFMLTILNLKMGYNQDLIWIPALVWCSVFIHIILTPELIYGYNFYKEKIDASNSQVVLPKMWNLKNTAEEIIVAKDAKLAEKVLPMLTEYIHKIEEASFHSREFRKPAFSIDDFASYLGVPSSHLNFIFKYYCKDSFVDYKKFVRIHDAIKLMENGYLKSNTIESLSAEVGFITYNTFYVAFKSITGTTAQAYLKRL
jgi:AraC-like DNA-binding protein